MAADSSQQETHRPGVFKQQNKSHKHGKHRSKSQLGRENKGRVNVKVLSKTNKQLQRKADRRNQAQQHRQQKREEALEKKRRRGGQSTPPHFVVILPLHPSINTDEVCELLKSCDETVTVSENQQGMCHISLPRFRQRLSFYVPPSRNLHAILDAAKIADSLLLLVSADSGVDEFGDVCLSCLFGQGLPTATLAVPGLKHIPVKKLTERKKMLQKELEFRFPSEKLHGLDTGQEALLVLRHLTNQKLKPVHYRELRPHLIAENVEFQNDSEESEYGTLKVSGYLRGQALSANGLVHLPGWGDFQMSQIDAAKDPHPLSARNEKPKQDSADTDGDQVRILETCDPFKQESLESEVVPDPMEGEQTWPTEEELAESEAATQAKQKVVKRVPKGTSEYQAAWIINSDEEDEASESGDEDEDKDEEMKAVEEDVSDAEESGEEEEEEYETITMGEGDDIAKYDEEMDMDEEMKIFEKLQEQKLHVQFPDEIDTPMDKHAKIRFQRYRGLKSFRTSPWDPKENLPSDYARIFQFANFKRTRNRILSEDRAEGALTGWYITVHIQHVPKEFNDEYKPGTPVTLFGLLPHEQKISLLHCTVKRYEGNNKPIKSKERLVFQIGFRRFSACPIFSQHTNASKHKFERFLPKDGVTVATMYAPITFPPAPVLVFDIAPSGEHDLVGTGSLLSMNPNRIIAKRAVLSGNLLKINKKSAVVRYMFFNRDDIHWFKPVELRTKWGRRGHIKEPLGTHGHMKCIFDGQLKSQDTVLMNLFKRMFPKWTYNPHVPRPPTSDTGDMDTEEDSAYQLFD